MLLLTATRNSHFAGRRYEAVADSALVDAAPWVPVQHPLQHIFIGKTEIPPLCPNYDVIQN